MTTFLNAFLLVFAELFPILNPIGTAPIFLALTSSCTDGERNALARRVAINSVLLLAGSMLIGLHLLVFFGITLPVVRIVLRSAVSYCTTTSNLRINVLLRREAIRRRSIPSIH